MAEKVTSWRSDDGSLHDNEQSAKDADFSYALAGWTLEHAPSGMRDEMHDVLYQNRMALLPIFKLLNGGSPVVAPRREDQTNV